MDPQGSGRTLLSHCSDCHVDILNW